MNDAPDPLEDVLRNFQPRSVSAATRQQVAERIAARRSRRRVGLLLSAAALALAASLFAAFLLGTDRPAHHENDGRNSIVEQNHGRPVEVAVGENDSPPPSLWAYRRAADASMDDFGSLLQQHANELLAGEHAPAATSRFGDRERRLLN